MHHVPYPVGSGIVVFTYARMNVHAVRKSLEGCPISSEGCKSPEIHLGNIASKRIRPDRMLTAKHGSIFNLPFRQPIDERNCQILINYHKILLFLLELIASPASLLTSLLDVGDKHRHCKKEYKQQQYNAEHNGIHDS